MKQYTGTATHREEKPSHYNAIRVLEETDIRSLSKVIENSIKESINKNKFNANTEEKKKEYTGSVRYGISEIDSNVELKKYLVEQSERRLNIKNKLQYDINNFMQELVKMKEAKKINVEE